ncbi:hypothetical protein Taro_045062 [Colocasia esculenta]|uniref:DNAJ heat shock N-terminal domain-containing protein n=1 Tax=Colocasia esculenta TaxID=4460 RepID=A0A843WQ95_COLES|nr:hypothetical protein [Colocasia esculenta]
MAQLLSPVRADALFRFQSRRSSSAAAPFALWRGSPLGRPANGIGRRGCRWGRRRGFCVNSATKKSLFQEDVVEDYYAVLGVLPDATPGQIKKAYYNCMKACHPDLSGNDPETNNFCMFINEVYAVLIDPVQRMVYDEIHGYSVTGTNPFMDDTSPRDHAFVDEFSCIGCKNCANVAPDVFRIEEDFGRARVFCQSGNLNLVGQAIESCPVDCIHWTSAAQLSLLEDEMRRVERVNAKEPRE